jgi:cell division protein FtsI/penicillin-binding protein 2
MALAAFAALLVLRSAYLQLWLGGDLSARASRQYFRVDTIPAPRGDILDEAGRPLIQTLSSVSLAIAPREVKGSENRALIRKTLTRLGLSAEWRRRALDTLQKQRYVTLPGRYMPSEFLEIRRLTGVYVEPVMQRASFASAGGIAMIGRVGADGLPLGGLERALDGQLRGEPGLVRLVVDAAGLRRREIAVKELRAVTPGNTIVLSLNRQLQSIVEDVLATAVRSLNARGGEIVVLDPTTGAVRAMASHRTDIGFAATDAIGSPFEPGSAIKPLLVSRLLQLRRAKPDEVIETGHELIIPGRKKPLYEEHAAESLSLHDVVKYSSNIGMVKFTGRLSIREHFEALRDFGVGMPTGISLPGEASGQLFPAERWNELLRSSTAIGYGLSVTSLQLALAFGSIANGGQLLEPTLVSEVRAPDSSLIFRHTPRVVRRVMTAEVASVMRGMLRDVVVGGTARSAESIWGDLAGKTGTARRSDGGAGYLDDAHSAIFAGMFPASDPQLVIVVRLVDPVGTYGGTTAAPIAAAVLKAASVAHDAALEPRFVAAMSGDNIEALAAFDDESREPVPAPRGPVVVQLDADSATANPPRGARPVPAVEGLPLRSAVHALHAAGFRVRLGTNGGDGTARRTAPPAGSMRNPGELVVVHSRP